MTSLLFAVVCAGSIAVSNQTSPLDGLKQFEGHWKGEFTMGTMKMDVDMTWRPFAGRWNEVIYTYTAGQMKLDYRVMISSNAENNGFNLWMFGNDMPTPDQMKGAMEGKVFNIIHLRENQPDLKFSIDGDKNMVMSVTNPSAGNKEIAHALLKPVKP